MNGASEYLNDIYYNPEHNASYVGPDKLFRIVKKEGRFNIGRKQIKRWLQNQEPYSLQRQARYKFQRRRVIVGGIDAQWDIDLADVTNISKQNDGFKYILFVIDIFSRYLWAIPIKSKTSTDVTNALTILLDGKRKPWTIRSDRGKEFANEKMKTLLENRGVNHFYAESETKANYVERVIRTMKDIMYRYFTKNKTYRYVENLNDLVAGYNSRPHRSIDQMAPKNVNAGNEAELWMKQYTNNTNHPRTIKSPPPNIKVGDLVRISHIRKVFQRTYHEKWTKEVFVVVNVKEEDGLTFYKLKDFAGKELSGSFYPAELQIVNTSNNSLWEIEKIIKRRGGAKNRHVLVKWSG